MEKAAEMGNGWTNHALTTKTPRHEEFLVPLGLGGEVSSFEALRACVDSM
jgi:hypothetical protein